MSHSDTPQFSQTQPSENKKKNRLTGNNTEGHIHSVLLLFPHPSPTLVDVSGCLKRNPLELLSGEDLKKVLFPYLISSTIHVHRQAVSSWKRKDQMPIWVKTLNLSMHRRRLLKVTVSTPQTAASTYQRVHDKYDLTLHATPMTSPATPNRHDYIAETLHTERTGKGTEGRHK